MKTLKQLLELKKPEVPTPSSPIEPDSITAYVPKTKDEKRFMDKHVIKKTDDVNGNGDDHFRATNIKVHDRSNGHGYNPGEDQKVYESRTLSQILGEKKLTPAEMKKREEVAQAIHRENPGMAMGKKMAIATATAKKVAEETEQIDELKKSTVKSYMNKKVDQIHKDADLQYPFKPKPITKKEVEKNTKDLMRGHARLSGVKPTSEEVEHLEEGEVATSQYHHYHQEAKKMLEKISKGLDTHSKNVTNKNNYHGGSPHWGHVGDMKHFHRQIQDLHDSVLQQGEYAAPPQKTVKEETSLFENFAEDIRGQIEQVYEHLSDEHKQIVIEMIEAEQYEEIINVVNEVLNG